MVFFFSQFQFGKFLTRRCFFAARGRALLNEPANLREAVLATARNGCFSGDMAPLGLLATGQHVQNDGYMSQLAQLGVDVFNCDGDMLVPAWSP